MARASNRSFFLWLASKQHVLEQSRVPAHEVKALASFREPGGAEEIITQWQDRGWKLVLGSFAVWFGERRSTLAVSDVLGDCVHSCITGRVGM